MDKITSIINKFPRIYDTSESSILYSVLLAFANEHELLSTQLDNIDSMIGIDTTISSDIDNRWGKLLNIPRIAGESDLIYRSRLKNSIQSLSGGTASAIKYAVAIGLGINNDPVKMDNMIKIYDAWNYTDTSGSIDTDPGNIVCEIDLMHTSKYSADMQSVVVMCANNTKASGTNIQYVVINYSIELYSEMDNVIYSDLKGIEYSKLGME